MPTIIFQGLQSCCESQLSLNLTSFNHHFSKYQELSQKSSIPGATMCGWECIKAISTGGSSCRRPETEDNGVYVHPLIKSASSMLSEKSLEMCTENLGSETGSDTAGSDIFPSGEVTSLDDLERPPTKERRKSEIKKFNRRDLPPPLTTLRVSNPIRLGPHRESGRLVIEAIASIHTRHYDIHAERRDGRLRLSFLTDYSSDFYPQYAVRENKVEENDKCGDDAVFEDTADDCEIDGNGECGEELSEEKEEEDEEEEENVVEEDEERHEGDDSWSRKDIDGNNLKVGIKMGISEFQRPSICKGGGHGNKRLINWELFCVATS
ncbi:hypothetical protein Nepgr_031108 [Nepenthes gracilis]|uniref:FAF domain-containing protein n=1 Tax=Nepenthes gracilis TaxID=150966 RepID=A0AAD3Y6H1_NEPGR|nr:hypothetical protein Nepgr_031108 [Nepenthes gracilis]